MRSILGNLAPPPISKITLHTWKDDLTRIHDAAYAARLYSEKTEVSQIMSLYYIERPPKDMGNAYRASRSRINGRTTHSVKLLSFMKHLAGELAPEQREQLIDHLMKLRTNE